MTMYVIVRDNDNMVIAMSEEKKDVKLYFKQKKLKRSQYTIHTITDNSAFNTLMTHYDDLYIESPIDSKYVNTRSEQEIIDSISKVEELRLHQTLEDINHYLKNYNLTDAQRVQFKQTRKQLKKIIKQDFEKTVRLDEFIDGVSDGKMNIDMIRKQFHDTIERVLIFIKYKG